MNPNVGAFGGVDIAQPLQVVVGLAVVLVLVAAGPAAASPGAPPTGFFGVVPQARLSAADLQRMEGLVETLRFPIFWSQCEPRKGEFDFSGVDASIAAAAEHGIRTMPFAGHKPLIVSEIGVASDGFYPSAFVKGRIGQAEFLADAFARLLTMRRRWRIAGVNWFTWKDKPNPNPHCSFCQGAGLFDVEGRPKPAWPAYRRLVARARRR